MNKIAPYLKALTGALVAGLGVLALALEDEQVTSGEWITVATAFLTGLGAVWAIPNKDPLAQHQDESVQPAMRDHLYRDEAGESYIGLAVGVLLVVILVVVLFRLL